MSEGAMRVLGWIVAVMLALMPGLAGADEATAAQVLEGHESDVWSAAFSPDGRVIVTGSGDTTARVWDLPDSLWPAVSDPAPPIADTPPALEPVAPVADTPTNPPVRKTPAAPVDTVPTAPQTVMAGAPLLLIAGLVFVGFVALTMLSVLSAEQWARLWSDWWLPVLRKGAIAVVSAGIAYAVTLYFGWREGAAITLVGVTFVLTVAVS